MSPDHERQATDETGHVESEEPAAVADPCAAVDGPGSLAAELLSFTSPPCYRARPAASLLQGQGPGMAQGRHARQQPAHRARWLGIGLVGLLVLGAT
ncbi:MAG: hypothetical protein ACRCZD_11600, partial [Phycicoccus sp.]